MKQPKQNGALGKLPQPQSPKALDEKILAYSRSHAPTRSSYWQPRWATALVTACIVGVAIFIVQPQQLLPKLEDASSYSDSNYPEAFIEDSSSEESALSNSQYSKLLSPAETETALGVAAPAKNQAESINIAMQSRAKAVPQLQTQPKREALDDEAQTASPANAMINIAKMSERREAKKDAAGERSKASENDLAATATIGIGSPTPLAIESAAVAEPPAPTYPAATSSAAVMADAAAATAHFLDPAEIKRELEKCEELIEKGNKDGAQSAYESLKQRCSDCDLPNTLEQALARQALLKQANE